MILWDVGTAVTGAGEVQALGRYVRLDLDPVPDYLSHTAPEPFRYRLLGNAGAIVDGARDLGEPIQWADQVLAQLPEDVDSVWYRLVAGVTGTLYRGVELTTDLGIGAHVYTATAQTLTTGVATTITFDLEAFDPFGMHSPTTSPTRVTVAVAGWYLITAQVNFVANATGNRELRLRKNGTDMFAIESGLTVGAGEATRRNISMLQFLAAGDYVELQGYQTSGGNLDTLPSATYGVSLLVVRVG